MQLHRNGSKLQADDITGYIYHSYITENKEAADAKVKAEQEAKAQAEAAAAAGSSCSGSGTGTGGSRKCSFLFF